MAFDISPAAFSPVTTAPFIEPFGRRGASRPPDETAEPRTAVRKVALKNQAYTSQTTAVNIEIPDLLNDLVVREAARLFQQQLVKADIQLRIRELQVDALRGSEPFSEASLTDLQSFLNSLNLTKRPAIFLLDNGNLRALWRNDTKEQIGLQFLGKQAVQFVIFAKRPDFMMRESGIDILSAINPRIKASGAERLI